MAQRSPPLEPTKPLPCAEHGLLQPHLRQKALLAELDQVRRTGIATNDEELESALRSIAAPVRARSGEVAAVINVAIPWSPATMTELVNRLGPIVQATANEIAARVI